MNRTVCYILLLLSLSATFGKYVYIDRSMNWLEAQAHCRLFYTDLAPISNSYDIQQLNSLVDDITDYITIGLHRDSRDREKWMWSGGGSVSTFFWARGQPNNAAIENYGVIQNSKWHDSSLRYNDPFFCYNVVVVRERKTWGEALDYCKKYYHDLASIASDTEMLLIQKELGKNVTMENIWIGLHFFPGGWLWVDGQPMEYEAWGEKGGPSCPKVNMECGALGVTEPTKVTNNTVGTGTSNANNIWNHGVNILGNNGQNTGGSSASADVTKRVWVARDCEERHHFLCY